MDKSFQIVMDDKAHRLLKNRAKTMGLNIGQLVENLLGSLELRIQRAYDVAEFNRAEICQASDREIMGAIFKADRDGWSDKEIEDVVRKIHSGLVENWFSTQDWTPKIRLPGETEE